MHDLILGREIPVLNGDAQALWAMFPKFLKRMDPELVGFSIA
jgi:hypothetical protein